MSNFKQAPFNCVNAENISRVFCDEAFYTDVALKKPFVFFKKPANRISLHSVPGSERYVLKSCFCLTSFSHSIFNEATDCTEDSLKNHLQTIVSA